MPDAHAHHSDHDGTTIAIAALIGAAVIWGTATIGTKTALDTYAPFVLASLRWSLALAVLLPVLGWRKRRPVLDKRTAILGFTGIAAFNLFFNFGLQRTSAANGSLISGALPVVIALLSFVLLHERLPPIAFVGIAISIGGIVVTVMGKSLDTSFSGNVLMFGSVFVWALYSIYARQFMRGEDALAVMAGTALFGLVMMLPMAGYEVVADGFARPTVDVTLIVLYLALGPSLAGILFWSFGLTRIPASRASVFSNITPIVGILAAGLVLSEPITRYHIVGGGLVLVGVYLATRIRHR